MEKQTDSAQDSKSETISSISHRPDELELAGLVSPTKEEMDTLRHVPDKIHWGAYCKFSSLLEQPFVFH
jgi:hypothetical protein